MRRGEILGLREKDIDYKNNEIHISRNIVTSYVFDDVGNKTKKNFIDTTKTYESERDILLPPSLIPILKKAITLKKKYIIKTAISYNLENEDMIFLTENGKPLLTISKLLGHANIDVTASTYTHVMKKEKQKAVDTLSLLNWS